MSVASREELTFRGGENSQMIQPDCNLYEITSVLGFENFLGSIDIYWQLSYICWQPELCSVFTLILF